MVVLVCHSFSDFLLSACVTPELPEIPTKAAPQFVIKRPFFANQATTYSSDLSIFEWNSNTGRWDARTDLNLFCLTTSNFDITVQPGRNGFFYARLTGSDGLTAIHQVRLGVTGNFFSFWKPTEHIHVCRRVVGGGGGPHFLPSGKHTSNEIRKQSSHFFCTWCGQQGSCCKTTGYLSTRDCSYSKFIRSMYRSLLPSAFFLMFAENRLEDHLFKTFFAFSSENQRKA